MIFRYEIKLRPNIWTTVEQGTVLANGTLRWFHNGESGIAESYHFRFTQETVDDPVFIALRWWALEEDSRQACLARKVPA